MYPQVDCKKIRGPSQRPLRRSPEVRSLKFFQSLLQVSAGKDCNVSILGTGRRFVANATATSARGPDFPLLPISIGFLRRFGAAP
jgi:hypothetical protein